MKLAGRTLRVVLAAALFAGPAAAQIRVGPAGDAAVAPRIAAVPAAFGVSAVTSSLSPLSAASLPSGLGSAPSALAPAVALAAPADAPPAHASREAITEYRRLLAHEKSIDQQLNPLSEGNQVAGYPDRKVVKMMTDDLAATQAGKAAIEAAYPTVANDAKWLAARAFAGVVQALKTLAAHPSAAAGRAFDGAKSGKTAAAAPADDEAAIPEELPTDSAAAAPQMLEMFVTRESKLGVKKGQLNVNVGLIKGKGSEWYWGKFQKGLLIALKSGSQTMFVTRVEEAKTIKIASMKRKDFEGFFSAQRMAGKTVHQLRAALVQDLKDRQARRPGAPTPVSTQSEVRIVRFMSSIKARSLPENKDESAYPVAPRTQFQLPEALQGLNHLLPKTVLLDMRMFPEGMPYPLIEDMTKLMKTGVYFVLLSDKPNPGPGSVEELLTKRLGIKQRDQISRYKMVILSDDGNNLSGYSGNFSKPLPSVRFTPQQLEIMTFVAQSQGASIDAKSTRFDATLAKGADAAVKLRVLKAAMAQMRLNPDAWQWNVSVRDGKSVITARPQNLISALPHLMDVMREHEGVYANNSDMMVISRDPALLGALPGSVQPSAHVSGDGETLADQALAALLGPYRENKPGDLAASASKIQSFLQNPNRGFGGFGNIYMMTGHIMHSAFNWAIWRYRNTGVLPTADETVAMGRQIWEREAAASGAKNLLGRPGESLAGFYETVEMRLRAMHQVSADVLKTYPIAVGTELANMVVLERWKKGGLPDHRDIFRLIFDFVVARETADGKIEMAIVDFKTGQVPTLQSLEKDTQVQLYDMLVRQMWPKLPVAPYGGNGVRREVVDYKLNFLYTAGAYQPELNDWSRLKFDKFLKMVMNRIRRHNNPKPPKADAKTPAKDAKGGKDAAGKTAPVKIDKTRPKTGDAAGLDIPQTVPGLKIKKAFAQQIVAGTKKIEYRTVSTAPKGFVAIIQTFTDEEPGRPAEVVAFARIAKVTQANGQYEWHLTNVTPVKPYVVPNNKPGAIIWVKDVPVQGPRRLKRDK